jgi:hypothetical protein
LDAAWGGRNLSEYGPLSFIVKIWLEETAEEAGAATWRGHITHVPSGDRQYIKDLDQVRDFVAPYLEEMGVRFRAQSRVQRWMKQLTGC